SPLAFFPRRRPPLTHGWGRAAAGKECSSSATRRRARLCRSSPSASGRRRASRSGRQARTTVYPWGPVVAPAPCTVYASGVRHASDQELTHRTNGAFPGSPGGRTVTLSDRAGSLTQAALALPSFPQRCWSVLGMSVSLYTTTASAAACFAWRRAV